MRLLVVVLCLESALGFKFLAYNPLFGSSHVNFMGKISDALVEAGHEVVMLATQTDDAIKLTATKARVVHVPQCSASVADKQLLDDIVTNLWLANDPFTMIIQFHHMMTSWIDQCNVVDLHTLQSARENRDMGEALEKLSSLIAATIRHPGLLDALRAEKFDAAFSETLDPCGFGLFELLGIENRAVTQTMAIVDGTHYFTQTPANPAYVPTLMVAPSGEQMPFLDRVRNTLSHLVMVIHNMNSMRRFEPVFRAADPNFDSLEKSMQSNSLVFMNSDPLLDFPAPRSSRVIDIGGISVSFGHSMLNETWSAILDLRPTTVLLSFGTFVQSHAMPERYKMSIVEAFRSFPDVTFIWKYEKPEDRISEGVDNIIETTWLPQHDMLNDARLSVFITHGGQGSVTEANTAGIPLIVIPVVTDQIRNANQVKRNGLGIVVDKESLDTPDSLIAAIKTMLEDDSYRKKALKTARMLAKKPFAARDIFVRNMEFLAEFGPLRQLDHYGAHLNFIQYYLVDVIAFLSLIVLMPLISFEQAMN
ncbi:hypothetical protein PRIPAC_72407 [Pristionchus pacificus]|uniref:glucuronosyltransferase n=1 Tax=Pristionchus pacificus TaxID=54126 RepID=A0A2A6C1F7_PRIPA|nr:hypothetical protein PRIPAC_72407 [Pristionchus pacificus]|eukprot:PDM71939.1 Glycosyltransferase [Pristionchus pacificus]